MTTDMQAAGRFLAAIEQVIARLGDWAYSLALRFEAHDRTQAEARMLRGGYFSVSCGYAIDRHTQRWLLFAVSITREAEQWLVEVIAEEEDEDRSHFYWKSPAIATSDLDSFAKAIDRAFVVLEETLQLPGVVAAFAAIRTRNNG